MNNVHECMNALMNEWMNEWMWVHRRFESTVKQAMVSLRIFIHTGMSPYSPSNEEQCSIASRVTEASYRSHARPCVNTHASEWAAIYAFLHLYSVLPLANTHCAQRKLGLKECKCACDAGQKGQAVSRWSFTVYKWDVGTRLTSDLRAFKQTLSSPGSL